MTNLTAKTTAAEVLASHSGFVISPNISEYALSGADLFCRESMIVEYLQSKMSSRKVADEDCKSRLDQCRDNIIQLNNQIVIALLHGEPETSDYIQNRSERILALIEQAEELKTLAGTNSKQVA